MFLKKVLRVFGIFVFCWLFTVPTGIPLQRKWFSWKKSTRFASFLAIIFTSQWKNLQKFMHFEKNHEIFWNSAPFLCSKAKHAASGGCAAVIFWKKIHQICWFSGCDFHLPIKKSSADFAFWKKSWEFLKILYFFVFSFGRLEFLSKGNGFLENIHQICWFSGCDLDLQAKKSSGIYAFWKNSGDFLKILHLFCAQKLL